MPGARMNSPCASSRRSSAALRLPAMIDPLSVAVVSLPLLRPSERDIASAAAAIVLRTRARDAVALEPRRHRRRLEHADPVARRVDARDRDLRARNPDRQRLVADRRAGFRTRTDPGPGT